MAATPALSAPSAGAPFERTTIERRELGDRDVQIDVEYCGICHSDIHQVKDEWGGSIFPMVPGHEIAGVVAAVGSAVEKLSVGDRVGVGCLVDSCEECEHCLAGEEQFCIKRAVPTYNGRDYDGEPTYGGYSQRIVGGLPDTQEMLDFCAEHGIAPAIELIGADAVDDAYGRVERSDVRYRFVIDVATID